MTQQPGPIPPTTMRFPDDLKAALIAQAEKENRSMANLVMTFCREGLDNRKKQKLKKKAAPHVFS